MRMVGTHVDITDRKLNEEALRLSEAHLREENIRLRSTFRGSNQFCGIIGRSQAMQNVYETILKAAATSASVIIYGESGTGKEIVARTIHNLSTRGNNNFVPVNCGAIPDTLFESEFFGFKKGAFTGANADKPGYLDNADGGSLFMDEVGELSFNIQVKLLRAIEGGGYTPLGSREIRKPDIRVITATNRDLKELVKKGEFREDFYYRIHVIPISIPPLRERKEDIPFLIHHFLHFHTHGENIPSIPTRVMKGMLDHNWAGNVRELENTIQRYITLKKIDFLDISPEGMDDIAIRSDLAAFSENRQLRLREATQQFEKNLIRQLLHRHHWHRSKVASILGVDRRTLFRKIKDFELQ